MKMMKRSERWMITGTLGVVLASGIWLGKTVFGGEDRLQRNEPVKAAALIDPFKGDAPVSVPDPEEKTEPDNDELNEKAKDLAGAALLKTVSYFQTLEDELEAKDALEMETAPGKVAVLQSQYNAEIKRLEEATTAAERAVKDLENFVAPVSRRISIDYALALDRFDKEVWKLLDRSRKEKDPAKREAAFGEYLDLLFVGADGVFQRFGEKPKELPEPFADK